MSKNKLNQSGEQPSEKPKSIREEEELWEEICQEINLIINK